VQPCERAGEVGDAVPQHRIPQREIALQVAVGDDQQLVDLGIDALEHPLHQAATAQRLQPLICLSHPLATSSGEDHGSHCSRHIV
jgi:hypothetical protein